MFNLKKEKSLTLKCLVWKKKSLINIEMFNLNKKKIFNIKINRFEKRNEFNIKIFDWNTRTAHHKPLSILLIIILWGSNYEHLQYQCCGRFIQ